MNALAKPYRRGPLPGTTGRKPAEIARVATDAHKRGERMAIAVARHYGIREPAASMAIKRARTAGHDIPFDRRPPAAPKPRTDYGRGQPARREVLTCDCGYTVALGDWQPGPTMLRHTLATHGRAARAHERTPAIEALAAAS